MTRQAERKARREPQRRTSQEIVDAILDAAAQLIGEAGFAGMTTNRVADRAGVSIGSLYHYFRDKESIIAALDLRYRRESAARFGAALADFQDDFEGALRRAVRTFFDDGPAPAVRAALMRDVPASWVASNAADVWNSVTSAGAAVLSRARPDLGVHEARLRVFYAIHATQGISKGVALWRPDDLNEEETIELLSQQLIAMLLAPPQNGASTADG